MKKFFYLPLITLMVLPMLSHTQEKSDSAKKNRWAVNLGLLVQNGPFKEFSAYDVTNNSLHAMQIKYGAVGKAAMGAFVGFSYDRMIHRTLMFRIQGQLESSGWISGIIDVGLGFFVPLNQKVGMTFEAYFSIQQTGGTMKKIGYPIEGVPDTLAFYTGFFGFKGRVSVPVNLSKNHFVAPYISYAVYPWQASSVKNMAFNGFEYGALIDSFQIGVEFGAKF